MKIQTKLNLNNWVLTLLFIFNVGVSVFLFQQMIAHTERLAEVEEPLKQAILEMEINVGETAGAVLDYLDSHQHTDVDRLNDSVQDFTLYATKLKALTETKTLATLVHQVDARYGELVTLGTELMSISKARATHFQALARAMESIDETIDEQLQPAIDRRHQNALEKLDAALDMEINIVEAFNAIEGYMLNPSEAPRQKVDDSEEDFKRFEAEYRRTSVSTDEARWLNSIVDTFASAMSTGDTIITLTDQLTEKTAEFKALRERIDSIMDDEAQVLIQEETDRVTRNALHSGERSLLFLLGIGLAILVIMIVLNRRISRGIIHGVSQLANGAAQFAQQNFDHVIAAQPHEELDLLATAFNGMAKEVGTSHERLHGLLEKSPVALVMVDRTGTIEMVSDVSADMFGYDRSELVGQPIEMLVPMQHRDRHRTDRAEFQREHKTRPMGKGQDLYALRKDGHEFPIEVGLRPLEIRGQHMVIASVVDLTIRKAAEAELRESEQRFRLMVSEVKDYAIIMLDPNGLITSWNEGAEHINGYTADEALGRHFSQFYTDEENTARKPAEELQVAATVGRHEDEGWRVRRDGSQFRANVIVTALRDPGGALVGFCMVTRDITAQVNAEERRLELEAQLRQQQKLEAIGTLAGGVAHEINNPINGIMNYAQLLEDRLDAESPLQEFAVEIGQETERVARIVRNLLSFSRQEKESHSAANLRDIILETLSLVQTVFKRDQIAIETELPDNLPTVKCRSNQIQQVYMNLFTNARDALNVRYPEHDPEKRIRVTVRPILNDGRPWVRSTIEDRGIGIPDAIIERIFDPFFTTKDRSTGTGLGLSISHGIVTDHHGTLSVECEKDRHTRFHLDLPVDNGWEDPTPTIP